MDVLADVLRTLRVEGSVQGRLELGAPWGLALPARNAAIFHIVLRGTSYMRVDDELTSLSAGDLALLPHGPAFEIMDAPDTPTVAVNAVMSRAQPHESCGVGCARMELGGDGQRSSMMCGNFTFESSDHHPLLAVLPEVIVVRGEDGQAAPWLDQTLRFLSAESTSSLPGAWIAIDRLMDLIFIHAVRAWLSELPLGAAGWLGALRDPQILTALQQIHASPAKAWTVDLLARASGMSRSGFAARFRSLVGEAPLQYLTAWRMRLAAKLLLDHRQSSLAEIASRIGYQSEATFGVAFKRHYASSPVRWRRAHEGNVAGSH